MNELISREQIAKEIDEYFEHAAQIVPPGAENTLAMIESAVKNIVKMQETACDLGAVIKRLEDHKYWHAVEIVKDGGKNGKAD